MGVDEGNDTDDTAFDAVTSLHEDPLECRGLFPVKRELPSPTPGDRASSQDVKPQVQALEAITAAATASDLDGAARPTESSSALQEFEERLGLDASQLVVMNTGAETDADVDVDEDLEEPVTKVCDDCGLTYIPCPDKRLSHRCKRSFRCRSCPWMARSLLQLRAHEIEAHESRKPFECVECRQRFASSCSVRAHARMHAKGSSTCACPGCGANFDTTRNLNAHRKHCRAIQDDPFHPNGRPFICRLCLATFWTRVEVKRHVDLTHTLEHPHKCGVCVASFKTKIGLKHHLHVHKAQRTFTCTVCAARFKYAKELEKHLLRHIADPKEETAVKGELGADRKGGRAGLRSLQGLRANTIKANRD